MIIINYQKRLVIKVIFLHFNLQIITNENRRSLLLDEVFIPDSATVEQIPSIEEIRLYLVINFKFLFFSLLIILSLFNLINTYTLKNKRTSSVLDKHSQILKLPILLSNNIFLVPKKNLVRANVGQVSFWEIC